MFRRRTLAIRARCEAVFFGSVVAATDILPPRIRYGYVHRLTRKAFRRPLASLASTGQSARQTMSLDVAEARGPTCAMLAGTLDVGGIGSVVELLSLGLPQVGIRPVILCSDDGSRAARLRANGVDVLVAGSTVEAEATLRDLAPEVIQLHGAPEELEDAALSLGVPLVPVLHNTEIHYSRKRWRRFAHVLGRSASAIAVSELVRAFHASHVSPALRDRICVVPNAVPSPIVPTDAERRAARTALDRVLGRHLQADIVFVSLARYDSQKNIAGLVASFLNYVSDPRIHLVIAGDPSDWAELRRADAIRRSSQGAERVTLLGNCDARTLLAAADAFILNSYFEGWPVAATEAASMGLPLVLSDFGGARELVARDPIHSVLIRNACGPAEAVSDAEVARARRRCRHQSNAAELGTAVDGVAARARRGDGPSLTSTTALMEAMMCGHANVLISATDTAHNENWKSTKLDKRAD